VGELTSHFGGLLQGLRLERGYSCRKFAIECGLSRETVRQYEAGVSAPSNQSLMKMFAALGVNPEVDEDAKKLIAAVCKARTEKVLAKKRACGPAANSELKKFITTEQIDENKVDQLINLFFEHLEGSRTESLEYFIKQRITKILED